MAIILLHDTRVSAPQIKADLIMTVGPSDNIVLKLAELAAQIQDQCLSILPGWAHQLEIYCAAGENGLLLGSGLNHTNIGDAFARLRCKVGNINIHARNAAAVYRLGNDGVLMCKKLAVMAHANVSASGGDTLHPVTATWNFQGKLNCLQEFDGRGALLSVTYKPTHAFANQFYHICREKAAPRPSLGSTIEQSVALAKLLIGQLLQSPLYRMLIKI